MNTETITEYRLGSINEIPLGEGRQFVLPLCHTERGNGEERSPDPERSGYSDRTPSGAEDYLAEQRVVQSRTIAVFHSRNGRVYATDAECPHRGGPLADGLLGGSMVICPLHGWKFNLETGKPLVGDCPLVTYPVRLTPDGEIVLSLA